MRYHERNIKNLNLLGDKTKLAAYKWYQWNIEQGHDILIYETIRTKAQQAENVRKGVSKTMNSYHIVGQALDFVFVDSKGAALWHRNNYTKHLDAIKKAKELGFTSGYDWGWDSPHLQYDKIGYGKDTFKTVGKSPFTLEQPKKQEIKGDGETLKFTDDFLKKTARATIKAATDKKIIDAKWLKSFDNNTMTASDYVVLKDIIKERTQASK